LSSHTEPGAVDWAVQVVAAEDLCVGFRPPCCFCCWAVKVFLHHQSVHVKGDIQERRW
jgi:hypothetical protein